MQMKTYIAMLRGINVSGQKKVPMAELKALVEGLTYQNVRTYIQSGNVLFEYKEADPLILSKQLQEKIADVFGFEVPVIIRTPEEMQTVIKANPFIKAHETEPEKIYLTFLAETPDKEHIAKLQELRYEPEQFVLSGKEIYLYVPEGYGNAKLNNNLFENKLKVKATTRNWKTVNELVRLAEMV